MGGIHGPQSATPRRLQEPRGVRAAPRNRFEGLRRSAALGAVRVNGIARGIEVAGPRSQARERAHLRAPIARRRQCMHVVRPHRPPPLRRVASGAPFSNGEWLRRARGEFFFWKTAEILYTVRPSAAKSAVWPFQWSSCLHCRLEGMNSFGR